MLTLRLLAEANETKALIDDVRLAAPLTVARRRGRRRRRRGRRLAAALLQDEGARVRRWRVFSVRLLSVLVVVVVAGRPGARVERRAPMRVTRIDGIVAPTPRAALKELANSGAASRTAFAVSIEAVGGGKRAKALRARDRLLRPAAARAAVFETPALRAVAGAVGFVRRSAALFDGLLAIDTITRHLQ